MVQAWWIISIEPGAMMQRAGVTASSEAADAATPSTWAVISPGYSRIAWAMARPAKTSPPGELIRTETGPVMARSARVNASGETPPNHSASESDPTMMS